MWALTGVCLALGIAAYAVWVRRVGWRADLLLILVGFVSLLLVLGPLGLSRTQVKQDAVADAVMSQYAVIDVMLDDSKSSSWGSDEAYAGDLCGPISEDSPLFRGRAKAEGRDILFRVGTPDCDAPNPAVEIKVIDSGGSGVTSDSLRRAQ